MKFSYDLFINKKQKYYTFLINRLKVFQCTHNTHTCTCEKLKLKLSKCTEYSNFSWALNLMRC